MPLCEQQAKAVADALKGQLWQVDENTWEVILTRVDGSVISISGDAVREYENEDALYEGKARTIIALEGATHP